MSDRRSRHRFLVIALALATGAHSAMATVTPIATPDTAETIMVDGWPSGQFCFVDRDGLPIIRAVSVNGVEQVAIQGDVPIDSGANLSDFDAECDDGEVE